MDTVKEAVLGERVVAGREDLTGKVGEAQSEVAFLRRRLDRLSKLQSLLKEKYYSRLDSLSSELDSLEKQQWELKSLEKQTKTNKVRRSIIKRQIVSLERRKKTISEAIKQVAGYEKASNSQAALIEDEREVLAQRIHDLEQVLELAGQADLNKKELDIVSRRVDATQALLKEQEMDLSKRTIDLLFEFYIPPKNNRRIKF